MQHRVFSGPVYSPDGKWLAFNGSGEVFISAADGSHLRNLTRSPGVDRDPLWSRDGMSILFVSERNARTSVYRVSLDGSDLLDLTPNVGWADKPSFSPDGAMLVYWQGAPHWKRGASGERYIEDFGGQTLIIADSAGENPRVLARVSGFPWPVAWSPDGQWIAYAGQKGTWVIRPEGSESHRLTELQFLAWAPDSRGILTFPLGSRIGLDGARTTDPSTARALREFQPFGGDLIRDARLHWDSAGSRVAFNLMPTGGTRLVGPGTKPNGPVLLDPQGRLVADLRDSTRLYEWDSQLSWSPDGRTIAVSYHWRWPPVRPEDRTGGILAVAADGSSRTNIVPDGTEPE